MVSESHVQQQILEAWGSHPKLRLARVNTGAAMIKGRLVRFGVPGTADLCGILAPSGRMLQIEVKTKTGKQRDAQRVMERVVKQFGGVYFVARSLADADAAFAALGLFR